MTNLYAIVDSIKILLPSTVAFIVGIGITPLVAHYLYKNEMWKKKARTEGLGGGGTPIFNGLHKTREVSTPRMGGIVIWASVFTTTAIFWLLSAVTTSPLFDKLNFLSNNQTWLPLAVLAIGSFVGFLDDYFQVRGGGTYRAGGISLTRRIGIILLVGLVAACWFYFKLERTDIHIPFLFDLDIGILIIPFLMLVMVSLFSGGVIDGIDGLAGGVLASIFAAYAGIAFFGGQLDIAALCAVFTGGILAFLWFNIPPARFYMGETGMMGLTATLAVIAFLTRAEIALFVIALPLYIASASVIIQVLSKKFRNGKKVFLVAPIHHHFEALGWPPEKVTMRFWVVGVICAILGLIVALVG
jgi:phospho-N-acetylmuramoyl-pentapeptide-transferase